MFLNLLAGAGSPYIDPKEEREPPPKATRATPLSYDAVSTETWSEANPSPKLRSLFSKLLKPSDIAAEHLQAINVQLINGNCQPEDFLPLNRNGFSYVPCLPKQVTDSPSDIDGAVHTPCTTGSGQNSDVDVQRCRILRDRLAELSIDNDSGFRVVTRAIKPNVKPPRLAYLRKFWEGLENMSRYWDDSLDVYWEKPTSASHEYAASLQIAKRQKTGASNEKDNPLDTACCSSSTTLARSEQQGIDSTKDEHIMPELQPTMPEGRSRYMGRRTSTGCAMPDIFLAETIKAFVEAAVWPFQATVTAPRQAPLLQFNKLNLPVRQTGVVHRLPKDRSRARSGYLEGPILGIQIRQARFKADDEKEGADDSHHPDETRLDLMREIGGLLCLAQERARQGKVPVKPGEGQWWTEKPRWGGGPGGDVMNDTGNSDNANVLELVNATKDKRNRKRKSPAMLWKELKCGTTNWDPKTDYQAIGKAPDSEYDEVFMVSSLNRHVAISKLTVHSAYLEYVHSEIVPHPVPLDEDWSTPRLQRSKWYDLFDVNERVEAFQMLWGVMAYLTRTEEDKE